MRLPRLTTTHYNACVAEANKIANGWECTYDAIIVEALSVLNYGSDCNRELFQDYNAGFEDRAEHQLLALAMVMAMVPPSAFKRKRQPKLRRAFLS
jgi:hypothetical protein